MPYRTDYVVRGPNGELERRSVITAAPPEGTAPPGAAPTQPSALETARRVFLPERSLASEGPSIAGAIAGGMGGAQLGALTGPAAPIAVPALALGGAALGAFGGEAARVGYEQATGAAPAEPGTLLARGRRAALRGAAGEGAGSLLRVGGRVLAQPARGVLGAAEELAPVLAQDLPATVKTVAAAGGGVRRIGRLLNDPEALARFTPGSAAEQQTLLRAWWQRVAPEGPEAIVEAWDALGRQAQRQLAGAQRPAMQTVIGTMRPAEASLGGLLRGGARMSSVAGPAAFLGFPTTAAVLGVTSEAARQGVPLLLAPGLRSAVAAPWLAATPGALRSVAGPAALAGRTAVQTGTALAWPPPPGAAAR